MKPKNFIAIVTAATVILGEYADFMARYAEMTEKMNKLGEEDMNEAEALYYLGKR